jgi:hypothetical protein
MKKISLFFVMMLAFTVSMVAQSLPKPANPEITEFIDYGAYIESSDFYFIGGIYMGYSFPNAWDGTAWQLIDVDGNYLDTDKVSFSIYTDNDQVFTFTPEMFDQVAAPTTQFPYNARTVNGDVGMSDIHFNNMTNDIAGLVEIGVDIERFFDWRIGIQTNYTDDGQTNSSDIVYMEIYPQLQEAKNVTSTSFLADWSCDAENTFIINNFIGEGCGYFLYVVDKETQEVVLNQNVEPTDANKKLPGATYAVEGLTPGKTYEFYVEVKQNTGKSYQSVVREVTLPLNDVYMLGGDDQGWDCTDGSKKFVYDAENKVYTMTYTFPAENNYFGFTTVLAENNDDGGWAYIEPYRFGAIADEGGDFIWYEDQYNGKPIAMTWDAYHAIKIAGGEYKLTVNLTDMTLIIEKQYAPAERGDVNRDGAVNIADVTCLIDHLLSNDYTDSDNFSNFAAHVNDDASINIADVTALIDILLGGSN